MKLSILLLTLSMCLNASSIGNQKPLSNKTLITIHFTALTPDGCTVDVLGVYDPSLGVGSFQGKVTFGGGAGCLQGTVTFVSIGPSGSTPPESDIVLTFSGSDEICSSSGIEWTANKKADKDLVDLLNELEPTIYMKILEKAGCE
jgi:hypothetical protein